MRIDLMLKRVVVLLFILLLPGYTFGEQGFVQGPFQISQDYNIYIKKEYSVDYPLGLYLDNNRVSNKIDRYETEGDTPNIETVFFVTLKGIKNVIVLVSWHQIHRAESINGTQYKVYGYAFNNGRLVSNEEISKDSMLMGDDGEFNGNTFNFKYKTADKIKKYLLKKYQ